MGFFQENVELFVLHDIKRYWILIDSASFLEYHEFESSFLQRWPFVGFFHYKLQNLQISANHWGGEGSTTSDGPEKCTN